MQSNHAEVFIIILVLYDNSKISDLGI